MDATKQIRPGHTGLVGLPLFLTMMFCFALVMAHPGQTADVRAGTPEAKLKKSASSTDAQPASKLSTSSSPLPASSLKTAPVDTADHSPDKTATPQPDVDAGQTLQSALTHEKSGQKVITSAKQRARQHIVSQAADKIKHDLDGLFR